MIEDKGKFDVARFTDELAEGTLNRLVRVQLSKGVKDKGKMHYQLRIDNASPLVLNGLAAVGTTSKPDETPKVLSGICLSPRRSMTVPASEEVVKSVGAQEGHQAGRPRPERSLIPLRNLARDDASYELNSTWLKPTAPAFCCDGAVA